MGCCGYIGVKEYLRYRIKGGICKGKRREGVSRWWWWTAGECWRWSRVGWIWLRMVWLSGGKLDWIALLKVQ